MPSISECWIDPAETVVSEGQCWPVLPVQDKFFPTDLVLDVSACRHQAARGNRSSQEGRISSCTIICNYTFCR